MNKDTQWVVRNFLDARAATDLLDTNPPMHLQNHRLQLAEMVLTEVEDTVNDPDCLASCPDADFTRSG